MGNSTKFLDQPAAMHIGSYVVKAEKQVDFALENQTAGSTIDVLTVPAGAVIITAGILNNKVNTDTALTLTLGTAGDSGNDNFCTAATLGSVGDMNQMANQTLPMIYCHTETTLRSAIAAATATTAVVTYYVVYAIVNNIAAK